MHVVVDRHVVVEKHAVYMGMWWWTVQVVVKGMWWREHVVDEGMWCIWDVVVELLGGKIVWLWASHVVVKLLGA